ncbi:MAG: SDR family NAD(P)-dependent oxidoreductase [Ignavibacteriales bacterium]
MKLKGKVAIITGGTSGIGIATAILFAQEGCGVVIAARDEGRGKEAAARLASEGAKGLFVPCDVRRPDDCRRVVDRAVDAFGRLDILFNNAGVLYVNRDVVNTTEEEWDSTMDVNVKAAFLMSQHAIPRMKATGGGAIINTSSILGLVAGGRVAAYCAAKGAVIMLTKAMAVDHAADNIRVNCICPGSVDTPMLRKEMEDLGGVAVQRPRFAARHPMNRISSPEEVARAALYLASSDSSFVTGVALPVDGGRSAW